jgi:phosphoglycerate dehydrogenase-like enzyme
MKICLTAELADSLAERISSVAGDAELVRLEDDGSFDGDPGACEVLCFATGVTQNPGVMKGLARFVDAPALRWVQSPGAGVDNPFFTLLLKKGVRLTNASGIHAEPIAQYAAAYILHWERQVARHQAQQARAEWKVLYSDDLTAKTLGIVGYGGIGQATARIAKAIGMRVIATKRTPAEDPNVDELLGPDDLPKLLAASDYVLLCLPFSEATRHTISGPELAAMKESAVLINVARGGVVDEPALIEALQTRRIRGATLDVVSEEPLPASSPLWQLENCVLTPHDAGYSPLGDARLGELFLDNLGRYVRGEPLRNEVLESGFGSGS